MDGFFGIGIFELFLIAVIALVVLGPERLPGAMRTIANYLRQIRDIGSEFQSQFSEEIKLLEEMDPRKMINDVLDPSKTPASPKPGSAKPAAAKPTAAKPASTNNAAKSTAAAAAVAKNAATPLAEPKQENSMLPPQPAGGVEATERVDKNDGGKDEAMPSAAAETTAESTDATVPPNKTTPPAATLPSADAQPPAASATPPNGATPGPVDGVEAKTAAQAEDAR